MDDIWTKNFKVIFGTKNNFGESFIKFQNMLHHYLPDLPNFCEKVTLKLSDNSSHSLTRNEKQSKVFDPNINIDCFIIILGLLLFVYQTKKPLLSRTSDENSNVLHI